MIGQFGTWFQDAEQLLSTTMADVSQKHNGRSPIFQWAITPVTYAWLVGRIPP